MATAWSRMVTAWSRMVTAWSRARHHLPFLLGPVHPQCNMLRPQYAAPSLVHAPPGHPIVVGDCFTPYQSPMHALPALAPPHNGLDIPDHEEPPKPIDALRQAAGFTVRRFNGYYGKVTRLMRYNAKQLHLHFGWIPVLLPSVTVFKSLPHTFQVRVAPPRA